MSCGEGVLVVRWEFDAKAGEKRGKEGCYIFREHQSLKLREFVVNSIAGVAGGDVVMW